MINNDPEMCCSLGLFMFIVGKDIPCFSKQRFGTVEGMRVIKQGVKPSN